jgi:hypothetical protein
MDSARTCWAEGMNLPDEQVEALTLVSEEAGRREAFAGGVAGDALLLAPWDVDSWPLVLEERGWNDLAAWVREIRETA